MSASLINTEILPFKATAFHNGQFVEVSNATLKGKWSVVFFYPADFTFVCPTELGDLADHYDTFKALGVEVYGVSTDTHFTHKAWHDTSDTIRTIQYPMIGDPTHQLARNFEVLREAEGFPAMPDMPVYMLAARDWPLVGLLQDELASLAGLPQAAE